MGEAAGGNCAARELIEEHPEVASDLLAIHGFDVFEALWLDQTPSAMRQAQLLVGRLRHQPKESLYIAKLNKEGRAEEAAEAKSARAAAIASGEKADEYDARLAEEEQAARDAEREANPYEYFGWDIGLYKLTELINAVNILALQMSSGEEKLIPSWIPGDTFSQGSAEAVDLDASDFDIRSLF